MEVVGYMDPSQLVLTNAQKFVDEQSQNMSDSECFDTANQQIWVHFWGPGMIGVYYIIIFSKILKKTYFKWPDFPFSVAVR